jgi:hypothetical protein
MILRGELAESYAINYLKIYLTLGGNSTTFFDDFYYKEINHNKNRLNYLFNIQNQFKVSRY